MAGFIGEEPVMWLFSFCLVVEIEKEVTTDGDAAVVSGFCFIGVSEIVDVTTDGQPTAHGVEVFDFQSFCFPWAKTGE